jgi:hypothetical protein
VKPKSNRELFYNSEGNKILPLNLEASFTAVVGKSIYSGGFAGIYVFTHIASNFKYVGSSNLLIRRMNYNF